MFLLHAPRRTYRGSRQPVSQAVWLHNYTRLSVCSTLLISRLHRLMNLLATFYPRHFMISPWKLCSVSVIDLRLLTIRARCMEPYLISRIFPLLRWRTFRRRTLFVKRVRCFLYRNLIALYASGVAMTVKRTTTVLP